MEWFVFLIIEVLCLVFLMFDDDCFGRIFVIFDVSLMGWGVVIE